MISFTCGCGKQLQSQDEHAGKRVECPACGARLTVPDPYDLPRSGRRSRSRVDYEETPPSRTGLIVGSIIAGVVALGAIITVIIIVALKNEGKGGDGAPISGGDEQRVLAQSSNNLKQITLAMHNFNDSYGRLPPAVVYNREGKPLYSWRVLILPFVEQANIYQQFHFNEAWDSPHNQNLLASMPKMYAHPGKTSATETHYQVFDGTEGFPSPAFTSGVRHGPLVECRVGIPGQYQGQVFEAGMSSAIPRSFPDGTSNTIMVIEADNAVPWSKPADLPFGKGVSLPPLGGLYESGTVLAGMADGTVHTIQRKTISETTLRAAITANGGEVLGSDW
jgi:hypothetical protein